MDWRHMDEIARFVDAFSDALLLQADLPLNFSSV
jgi:hypothetical protein